MIHFVMHQPQIGAIQGNSILVLCIVMVLASLGAAVYAIEPGLYCGFSGLSIALVTSIGWRNFSWSYAFLAAFFVLGHWLKVTVHAVIDYRFVEPVGAFSGNPAEWALYYQYAAVGMLALLSARLAMAAMPVTPKKSDSALASLRPPKGSFWFILIIVTLIFYSLNTALGFFRTGIRPTLILPFPLHAILSFMAFLGFAIVVAWYVSDELTTSGRLRQGAWICLLVEGSVASISMVSRMALSLHVLPVFLAVVISQRRRYRGSVMKYAVGFFIVLVSVLTVVSMTRAVAYYGGSALDRDLIDQFVGESGKLFVDRWVGVEGILTAVSGSKASLDTFLAMLKESPNEGVFSIYQSAAGSFYRYRDEGTFLTLPGAFGILAFSGSLPVMFLGGWVCVLLARSLEQVTAVLSRNRLPVIVLVSCASANALTQMSFPWLFVPFAVQVVAFLVVMATLSTRALKAATLAAEAARIGMRRGDKDECATVAIR